MRLPRILLVEDDPDSAEALSLLLEIEGFQVCCANSGAQAIEAFVTMHEEARPDLLVLDLMLPDMQAVTLVSRLAEIDVPPPIVILSAASDAEIESVARDVSAAGVLRKPAPGSRMVGLLRSVIGQSALHV
jgi:DNA-binding response OmpR family regulator